MQLAPFLEHVQARAGDSLRAVEWYRDDESELIYLRDDLDLKKTRARADAIHQLLTGERNDESDEAMTELGDRMATVNLYEGAVLINLPFGEDYGVVIGLEPIAARNLHEFVLGCRTSLEENDPLEEE